MKVAIVLAALAAGAYATPISSIVPNEHDLFYEPLFDHKGAHAVQAHEKYLAERLKHQHTYRRDVEEEAQNGLGHEEPAAVVKEMINEAADLRRPMIPFTPEPSQTLGFPTHHERPTKQAVPSIPSFSTHPDKQTSITFLHSGAAAQPSSAKAVVVAPLAEATPAVTKEMIGAPQVPTAALPTHHDKRALVPWPKIIFTTTTRTKSTSTSTSTSTSASTKTTISTAKPSTSTTTTRFHFEPAPTTLVSTTTHVPRGFIDARNGGVDPVILSSEAAELATKPPATTTTKSATVTTTSSKMKTTHAPRDVAYEIKGGVDPRILAAEASERSSLKAEAVKTDKAALEPRRTSPVPSKWTVGISTRRPGGRRTAEPEPTAN